MSFVTDPTPSRKSKSIELALRVLTLVSIIMISYQSLTPAMNIGGVPGTDKLIHALAYFTLAGLALGGWQNVSKFKIAGLCFLFGCLIEVLQGAFISGRTGSVWDGAANLTGIICAVLLSFILWKKSPEEG